MTVRIHPPEQEKDYTDLLLALLAQAAVPVLRESLSTEKHPEDRPARPS